MKSVAAEEKRIQQQIVAQQKKELTTFLENQKKEYRLCKDKIKEVHILNKCMKLMFHTKTHFLSRSYSLCSFVSLCACVCVSSFLGLCHRR